MFERLVKQTTESEGVTEQLKAADQMLYGRLRQGVTQENFMQQIESYIVWYRDTQIKLSLGGLSSAEFRTKTGITI